MKKIAEIITQEEKKITVQNTSLQPTGGQLHLERISSKLTRGEEDLVRVKYRSLPFLKLNPAERIKYAQVLLLKIHVSTGWRLPESDEMCSVLEDQFLKKLLESYPNCNPDEIEYAFRNYGTSVKDWGKNLNLSLIDTVMNAYLADRKCLSEFEERFQLPEPEQKPMDEQIIQLKREVVEMKYQSFIRGSSTFELMPEDGLATLSVDGYCEMDLYEDFLEKAHQKIRKRYEGEIEKYMLARKSNLAFDVKNKLDMLEKNDSTVVSLAKKMALVYCFMRFKEAGFKNIYINEKP